MYKALEEYFGSNDYLRELLNILFDEPQYQQATLEYDSLITQAKKIYSKDFFSRTEGTIDNFIKTREKINFELGFFVGSNLSEHGAEMVVENEDIHLSGKNLFKWLKESEEDDQC